MKYFKKWDKDLRTNSLFSIENIKWDTKGLKIDLCDLNNQWKIQMIFSETVYSYKNTLESYMESVWISNEEEYFPFYYSIDTQAIKDLKAGCEYIEEDRIIHFLIKCIDNIIEVFTSDFPEICVEKIK